MRADQHVHSDFSPDCENSMTAMCQGALDAGISHITFTEHADLGHPNPLFDRLPNPAEYEAGIQKVRAAFPNLGIGKGMEIGYYPKGLEQIKTYLRDTSPLDVVLWSVHVVDGLDAYSTAYFENKTRQQAYGRYLESVLESLQAWDGFDVVAHIGYVWKFRPEKTAIMQYEEFPALLDKILTTIIKMEKSLEINTSGFVRHDSMIPSLSIVARYAQLGGKLITLGSDAHEPKRVGGFWEQARKLLVDAGLSEYALYQNRQRKMVSL